MKYEHLLDFHEGGKVFFVPGKQANLVKAASGPAFDVCCHEKSTIPNYY